MSAPSPDTPPATEIDPEGDAIIVLLPEAPPKETTADQNAPSTEGPKSSSTQTTPVEPTPIAQFRVCSKHLTLASPYFKAILSEEWSEGETIASDGSTELSLWGFDAKALQIILNAIHGRSRQVPRSVNWQLVVELAKLTDYLQCQEIIEPFGQHWVTPAATLPEKITTQLKGWIMASVCFRHAGACQHTTRISQQCGTGPFDPDFLPIPRDFVSAISHSREVYLGKLFQLLRQRFEQLRDGPITCNMACDAMYLGLMMKFNAGDKLPFTQIPKPYTGYSASYVRDVLNEWESKMQYVCLSKWRKDLTCLNRESPLGKELSNCLEEMDSTLTGYQLPELS